MAEPIFWLGLSILLVAVCLTAVLVVAIPALRELSRAARSAEKLFDTLSRELPPTLEAIRLTGMEISELTDEMNDGVQSASRVVQQVDQSVTGVRQQARQANVTTRSVFAGVKAAWRTFTRPNSPRRPPDSGKAFFPDREAARLPHSQPFEMQDYLQDDYSPRSPAYDWAESADELQELDGLPPPPEPPKSSEPPHRVSDRTRTD